jgi:hypothetical protein
VRSWERGLGITGAGDDRFDRVHLGRPSGREPAAAVGRQDQDAVAVPHEGEASRLIDLPIPEADLEPRRGRESCSATRRRRYREIG